MLYTKNLLFSLFIMIQMLCFSVSHASIKNFESKYYNPIDHGLKDLVFEVEIPNLKNTIKEQFKISNLEDIYFRVYWIHPDIYRIEVNGFPDGFTQLKKSFVQQIYPQMEYVIPEKYSSILEGYELKTIKEKDVTIIIANDKSGMKDINEMRLLFDNNGKLKKTTVLNPLGIFTSDYNMTTLKLSHGKFIISKKDTISTKGIFITTINVNVNYDNFKNFVFPKMLTSITKLQSKGKNKKARTLRRKSLQMNFRNYIINQGVAKKYITKSN